MASVVFTARMMTGQSSKCACRPSTPVVLECRARSVKYCQTLPVQAVLCELLAEDGVGLAHGFETVAGDGAEAADAEAGAGERLTEDHAVGQAELPRRQLRTSSLKRNFTGSTSSKLQLFGQTADVVVGLDAAGRSRECRDRWCPGRGSRCRRACAASSSKTSMNSSPMILRLLLGLGNARELIEEAVGRVDIDEICAQLVRGRPR